MKDPEKYGFEFQNPAEPLLFESVTIEKPVQLKVLAKEIGVNYTELTGLNPELRQQVTPATPYPLKVPVGKGEVLLAKMENIKEMDTPAECVCNSSCQNR